MNYWVHALHMQARYTVDQAQESWPQLRTTKKMLMMNKRNGYGFHRRDAYLYPQASCYIERYVV
jgi:hypothetical protein